MERKLATVLFADLVGSTQLLDGQDPEITRRRVTSFFDGVQRCIETHGGTVRIKSLIGQGTTFEITFPV